MLDIRPLLTAFHAGRMEEAETLARQLLAVAPGQVQASLVLGNILLRRGVPAEAEGVLVAALAQTPRQPDLLNLRGVALAQLGRKDEALDDLDRAIDIRLNHPSAHQNLCALLAERRDSRPRFSVTVITPSIGTPYLRQALASVQAQTYPYLDHLVVADGPEHHDKVRECLPTEPRHPVNLLPLPYNVGRGGFNGHRVYGSTPFLANGSRPICARG